MSIERSSNVALGMLKLMRPSQWIKNFFIFAPLIFSGEFRSQDSITKTLIAFLIFTIAASSVYILNDLIDKSKDQIHPIKKLRPIASGAVSSKSALMLYFGVLTLTLLLLAFNSNLIPSITGYIVLNLLYTLYLKSQPVVEIFIIAFGFVLRVYAGGAAINVPISDWMFVTVLSLALYLAALKRKQEILNSGNDARKVLNAYSEKLMDRYAEISAISSLLFYSMYVMNEHPELVLTIPFVLFGLFRYWYLIEKEKQGESPSDVLLKDAQLFGLVTLWLVVLILNISQ
jgi:4-hydroxybenzoate polyprenyltransferase